MDHRSWCVSYIFSGYQTENELFLINKRDESRHIVHSFFSISDTHTHTLIQHKIL